MYGDGAADECGERRRVFVRQYCRQGRAGYEGQRGAVEVEDPSRAALACRDIAGQLGGRTRKPSRS